MSPIRILSWGVLAGLLAACAAPVQRPAQAGFLQDYSRLEQVEPNHLLFADERASDYSQFIVERPRLLYQPTDNDDQFSADELAELQQHVVDSLTEQLTRDESPYRVVDQPGPGVARFRIAVTDLDATDGILNVSLLTKVTGAGLGGIATEAELVDSVSGEQLAAQIRWGSGSRILRAGFTRLGDAKIKIDSWARDVRRRLDAARAEQATAD